MIVVVIYMLFAAGGLAQELVFLGIALADRKWFARLGFSETAQDVSFEHVVSFAISAVVKFAFALIGVVAVASPQPKPQPITFARIIASTCFILIVALLTVRSSWLQYRRARLADRERPRVRAPASIG